MPPAQAWRTLRYSSTLKILAPSLLSQKGKGWTTFTPPAAAPCRRFRGLVSHRRSHGTEFQFIYRLLVQDLGDLDRRARVFADEVHPDAEIQICRQREKRAAGKAIRGRNRIALRTNAMHASVFHEFTLALAQFQLVPGERLHRREACANHRILAEI